MGLPSTWGGGKVQIGAVQGSVWGVLRLYRSSLRSCKRKRVGIVQAEWGAVWVGSGEVRMGGLCCIEVGWIG